VDHMIGSNPMNMTPTVITFGRRRLGARVSGREVAAALPHSEIQEIRQCCGREVTKRWRGADLHDRVGRRHVIWYAVRYVRRRIDER